MQDEAPGNDPKKLWQNQSTEPSSMTLLLVQKKTRELHRKTRGELLKSISGPLIAGLMGGFGIRFPDPVMQPVFGLVIIWSMAGKLSEPASTSTAMWSCGNSLTLIPFVIA